MDAAFAFVKPGPSTGTLAFTFCDWARAGLAAYRAVALGCEGVHWQLVGFDVFLDLVAGPRGHGVELDDVKVAEDIEVVEFDDAGAFACFFLLRPDAGDPDIDRGEFFLEGHHLAERATEIGLGSPEVRSQFGGLLSDRLLRVERLDGDAQAGFDFFFQGECFRKEKTGIDGENREVESMRYGRVHGHQPSALEACADRCALAIRFPSPREDIAEGRCLELLRFPPNHVTVVE